MSIEKDTKLRNKFDNSKIYKLIDNTNNNVYIGSCCSSLKTRLSKHKFSYIICIFNNIKSFEIIKNKDYIKSFEIIKNGNYKIELLEDCEIKTKDELLAKERYYIENNDCLNKCIPVRTEKEYKQYQKEYRETNKDKANEKFVCQCGGKHTRCGKSQHINSTKHLNYLESLK